MTAAWTWLAAAALAGMALLSGCSQIKSHEEPGQSASVKPAPTSSLAGSDADAGFARQMAGHRQQALQMAELASTRGASPGLLALATDMIPQNQEELTALNDLISTLTSAATNTPAPEPGASAMPQAPTDLDVTPLSELTGPDFDLLWLDMMIRHHEQAIAVASRVQTQARATELRALATAIITTSQQEVRRMRALQQQPPAPQDD